MCGRAIFSGWEKECRTDRGLEGIEGGAVELCGEVLPVLEVEQVGSAAGAAVEDGCG